MFDKFYQGDASHTVSGNGLGLSIARRIVALHNGDIRCKSQEGAGTEFTVELPYRK
ncbi:MAG: HAMP domain-containing sensor histidine kinase [Eubacteriales bacterium]|nr:HAMP domain-containing sensor histidine kinase [Eubacteriales bacterium]